MCGLRLRRDGAIFQRLKTSDPAWPVGVALAAPFFDIVNGFFDRCRDGVGLWGAILGSGAVDKKAEIISARPLMVRQHCRWWCGLSSVR